MGAAWSWARAPRSAWQTPSAPTPRSRLATWAPGGAGGAGLARGGLLSPWSPLPPGVLGQLVPPVQSVLRCTLPHLQGLLLTLQGPSGPSVTPGTPRARLPERPAQDLGSEHSCTLPCRPRPHGALPPQLNAPGGHAVLQTPPARSLAPAHSHLLPAVHSLASCPLVPTGGPALSSSWSLHSPQHRGLSAGLSGGWGVLERGAVTSRDAQSRAWGHESHAPLLLQLLPGAPQSPALPSKHRVHMA